MNTQSYDEWERMTYGKTDFCHDGNMALYQEPNGGTLFIGGWTNGAEVTAHTHVIDLTGLEHKFYEFPTAYDKASQEFTQFINPCAGWLSLPFPDYGVPKSLTTRAQWEGIASTIRHILQKGTDVLVACHGGHGRSGLFCAIVGYILGIQHNRAWSSPVEHIRQIYCSQAVETYAQESYVYNILGLDIKIVHQYATAKANTLVMQPCPICGISSSFVTDLGMCMGCKIKFESKAPVVTDLTQNDIDHPIAHDCTDGKKCIGIYKAKLCGHVVHNMLVIDGLCETCAQKADEEDETVQYGDCAICQKKTSYAYHFGICYQCQEDLKQANNVDYVHDSILDGFKAVPHYCTETVCIGVVAADICKHVVHDKEIIDGLCPYCYAEKHGKQEVQ